MIYQELNSSKKNTDMEDNHNPWKILNCEEIRTRLETDVDPDKMWSHLKKCQQVDENSYLEMCNLKSRISKMKKLLDIISKKGSKAFEAFRTGLKEDHRFLIKYHLSNEEKALAIQEQNKREREELEYNHSIALEKAVQEKEEFEEEMKKLKEEAAREAYCLRKDLEREQQEHKDTQRKLEDSERSKEEAIGRSKTLEKENYDLKNELAKEQQKNEDILLELKEIKNFSGELKKGMEERENAKEDTERESDHRQRTVTSAQISSIVDHVGPFSKDLGARLGVSAPVVKNIETDNPENRDRIWQILLEWREKVGKGATLDTLVDVLTKLQKTKAVCILLGKEVPEEEVARARAESAKLKGEKCEKVLKKELDKQEKTRKKFGKCTKVPAQLHRAAKEKETLTADREGQHIQALELGEHELSERDEKKICKDLGCCWQDLGRELRISDAQIQKIASESSSSHTKAMKVLKKWKEGNNKATAMALSEALHKIGKGNIIEKHLVIFIKVKEEDKLIQRVVKQRRKRKKVKETRS